MDDFSLDAMTNPALVEKRILDSFEEHVTNGDGVVVDANNTFMFIVEMFSQLTADTTDALLNKLNALYPQRALTPEDLYMHMSDYDYVGLFASPASINMELILGKQEMIDEAVPVYEGDKKLNYSKIVIPDSTVFQIGSYTFGLYYPIEIRINNETHAFSVVYDTSTDDACLGGTNPLTQLTVNTVEYAFQSYKDIDIVSLRFPVYQFVKTIYLQDITSSSGYRHTFNYTDKFYAIRIYRSVGGVWKEIHQTLSDTVYDPMEVTAKLVVNTEDQTVQVTIPQIYFTSGLISSQLKVDVYTTLGAMDMPVTDIAQEQIKCTFGGDKTDTVNSNYSRPLERAQTIQLFPASTKIYGGGDGYDFESLRSNVINNTFYSKVIARFAALEAKLKSEGFEIAKHQDSIMNRVFFCSKAITDMNGDVIASGSVPLHVSSTIANLVTDGSPIPEGYRWCRYRSGDKLLMVLPPALMKYDPELGYSTLVKNDDYPEVLDDVASRAAAYNKYQYTYQPFHLRVSLQDTYPVAYSYNLMNPSVDRIFFKGNNAAYGESINGYTGTIVHKNGGTGGFTVRFAITLSEDLITAIENINVDDNGDYKQNIWLQDIIVYLKYVADNEAQEGCYGILTPTLEKTSDGKYLYELEISTDYFINENHYIEIGAVNQSLDGTKTKSGKLVRANRMPLSSENWILTFLLHKDKIGLIDEDREASAEEIASYRTGATTAGIGTNAQADLGDDYIAIAEQQVTLRFGEYMSQLLNDVEVFTGDRVYETYPDNVYATLDRDDFLRSNYTASNDNNTGALVTYMKESDVSTATDPDYKITIGVCRQANDWLMADRKGTLVIDSIAVHTVAEYWSDNYEAYTFKDKYLKSCQMVKYTDIDNVDWAYYYLTAEENNEAYRGVTENDLSTSTAEYIIYDFVLGRAVKLVEDNIAAYVTKSESGTKYHFCLPYSKDRIVLKATKALIIKKNDDGERVVTEIVGTMDSPLADSLNLVNGDGIQEVPKTVNGKPVSIDKRFAPGVSIHSFKTLPDGTLEIALNTTKLAPEGTVVDATDIRDVGDYTLNNILGPFADDLLVGPLSSTSVAADDTPEIGYQEFYDAYKDFWMEVGKPLVEHAAGSYVVNESGRPRVISERSFLYYIDCIQLDARAFLNVDINTNDLRNQIASTVNDYAAVVDRYIPELLENTHLYYQPKRSIGNTTFSIGNEVLKTLPLQIATEFTLTVKSFVYESDELRDLITNKILGYVAEQIEESTLSVTAIAKRISSELEEYVDAVAVSGFNTKEDLSEALSTDEQLDAYNTQVLKVVDDAAKISIRRIVYVDDRKTLATKRGVTVNFIL